MTPPSTIRPISPILLALAAATLLTACEARLSDANLREVKPAMTTKEVESILGPPESVEGHRLAPATAAALLSTGGEERSAGALSRYIYEQDGRKVELTFAGDRLLPDGIRGSFER